VGDGDEGMGIEHWSIGGSGEELKSFGARTNRPGDGPFGVSSLDLDDRESSFIAVSSIESPAALVFFLFFRFCDDSTLACN
jgi:hypothetical protein